MINLVVNAIKYNRARRHGQDRDRPGRHEDERVRIQVTDTGRGISAEAQAKLFVPFERLDAADSGIDGVGLGLALSRNLVEAMRGHDRRRRARSATGSTFWVELARGDEVTVADSDGGAVADAGRRATTAASGACSTSRTRSPTSA